MIKQAKSSAQIRNENLTGGFFTPYVTWSLQAGSHAAAAQVKMRPPETSENERLFRRFASLADFAFV